MSAGRHWAYAELKRRLEARRAEGADRSRPGEIRVAQEYGTVYLFDPAARERLDEEIRGRYFPAVIEGLRGSPVCVHDEENVLTRITDKRDPVATRQLIFLLEEPPQPPAGPDSPPWYARGTIDCSLECCMVSFDLILGLPLSFPIEPLLELMGDRRMQGDPPRLSIEFGISGRREYALSFSWGRGAAVGMERVITESVKKHLAIIQAVNRLELQWESRELFSALSARIIAMYGEDVFRRDGRQT
jgi:hypothetical protein